MRKLKAKQRKAAAALLLAGIFGSVCPVAAAADAAAVVTQKFDVLKDLVLAVVTAVGAIVTLWGIFELGNSMQNHDGSAIAAAFKRISGGLIMIIAPQLLPLLL